MEGEENNKVFQPVEIKKIIKGKNPKLAKRIPGFIYYLLNKILHLNEVNDIINNRKSNSGVEFISEVIKYSSSKYEISGIENIPETGKFIFASNHPLGGLDGLILLKILNEKIGTTRTLTNDFLMEIGPLKEFFVPVNKVGKQARNNAPLIEDLYNSEDQILIFPAGLCSRKINGAITDLDWNKHFIQKAIEYKRDIIPIHFEGKNSGFFYNLANLRKKLKIKFNIEMIFLADEMFRIKNRSFHVYFGKPIPYTFFNNSKKPLEWAKEIKNVSYSLTNTTF
jgi:1-acyl-sn-glycerol-3-phosphate acyltransferase